MYAVVAELSVRTRATLMQRRGRATFINVRRRKTFSNLSWLLELLEAASFARRPSRTWIADALPLAAPSAVQGVDCEDYRRLEGDD